MLKAIYAGSGLNVIVFAFNAKSFPIAILVFFLFFLLITFSGRIAKSFLANFLTLVVKKTGDQVLTHSWDIWKYISVKIVPEVVIPDACGIWKGLHTVTSIYSIQKKYKKL